MGVPNILDEPGIVVNGIFYSMQQVVLALTLAPGMKVKLSGCRRGDAVLTVPTANGVLYAYNGSGGDKYPGINVDVFLDDKEDGTVSQGLVTVENVQQGTKEDDGLIVHVYGDLMDDSPTDSFKVENQGRNNPLTLDKIRRTDVTYPYNSLNGQVVTINVLWDANNPNDFTALPYMVVDETKLPAYSNGADSDRNVGSAVGEAVRAAAASCGITDWNDVDSIPEEVLAQYGISLLEDKNFTVVVSGNSSVEDSEIF